MSHRAFSCALSLMLFCDLRRVSAPFCHFLSRKIFHCPDLGVHLQKRKRNQTGFLRFLMGGEPYQRRDCQRHARHRQKKLKYKANRRNAVKRVYQRLFALFFSRLDRCHRLWSVIRNQIKKSLSAVRPGRRFCRAPNSASHSCVHARACLS